MDYQRIQPFPASDAFAFPELRALASVWRSKKSDLESSGAYKDFLQKMQREWAIETGIIERLYTWDRGVTEMLIDQGIESSLISHLGGLTQRDAEHVHSLIEDHLNIVEGLFGLVKGETPLSEHFIRGLQAEFTAHQDYTEAVTTTGALIQVRLLKGEYKTQPNNPRRPGGAMHVYCPPELTKEEMEVLVRLYREAEDAHTPEVKAAWLHHRFTQIHPFQDGNGRVARALASLVFLRDGLFPLVVRESERQEYIGALESADGGDLSPLVSFFVRGQRESILRALGLEQQVQQGRHAEQIITSAIDLLKNKFSQERQKISVVYDYAEDLLDMTRRRFTDIVDSLDSQLADVTPPHALGRYHARHNSANNTSEQRHYFQRQIVDVAKRFNYFASFEPYRSWARITIRTEQEFDYVISFHGYGPDPIGILAASALTYVKVPREDGGTDAVALQPAATDLFQFNYAEPPESTKARYAEWLNASISVALAEWRRSLQS